MLTPSFRTGGNIRLTQRQLNDRLAPLAVQCMALAIISFNLNYFIVSLASSGARQQVSFSPEAPLSMLLVAVGVLFLTLQDGKGIRLHQICLASAFFFSGWTALTSLIAHGNARATLTLVFFGALAIAGYSLVRAIGRPMTGMLCRVLPALPFATLATMLLLLLMGRLEFQVGWLKPQIVGGIRSSETAIFVGLQALYCLFALDVRRVVGGSLLVPRLGFALSALLLFWLLSFGSVGALLLVLLVKKVASGGGVRFVGPTIAAIIVGSACLLFLPSLWDVLTLEFATKAEDYTEEGVRLPTILLLVDYTFSAPLVGIGLGEFAPRNVLPGMPNGLYPHNNVLGIAAELGIPAALCFVFFTVLTIVAGIRAVRSRSTPVISIDLSPIAMLALLAFVYLQVKGLVQDTWQLKEMYVWAGVIAGAYAESVRRTQGSMSASTVSN